MVTPKEEPSAEILSTLNMTIIIWTLKKENISWAHFRKKNFKYGKHFFTSFSRLPN